MEIDLSDPCQQPSTGTTIKDLPYDCLQEIFQFFANPDNWKIGQSFELRTVCKDFKFAIDSRPCFLTNINASTSNFLRYRILRRYNSSLFVNLFNKEVATKFINESFLSEINKEVFYIKIKLNEKNSANFLNLYLKKLDSQLLEKNSIKKFEVNYNDSIGPNTGCHKSIIFRRDTHQFKVFWVKHPLKKLTFIDKDIVTKEELKLLGDAKRLDINGCKKFKFSKLKGLSKLKTLYISYHCTFKGDELNNIGLDNIKNISISNCKKFSGKGLHGLKSLRIVTVINCNKFNKTSSSVRKLKKKKCIFIDDSAHETFYGQ